MLKYVILNRKTLEYTKITNLYDLEFDKDYKFAGLEGEWEVVSMHSSEGRIMPIEETMANIRLAKISGKYIVLAE